MRAIGFSTGALAKGDFETGVRISRSLQCTALELSALRLEELDPLVKFVTSTDLTDFEYVSIHAPSQLTSALEESVISVLHQMSSQRGWNIVVHPDCISNFAAWNAFGERLNIENMDKRKPIGRTLEELESLFQRLPAAKMCFDIAHARQVDSTMAEAYRIVRQFGPRICQIHISEVNTGSI